MCSRTILLGSLMACESVIASVCEEERATRGLIGRRRPSPVLDRSPQRQRPGLEAPKYGDSAGDEAGADVRHDILNVPRVSDGEERLTGALLMRRQRLDHLVEHGRVLSQTS